MTRLDKSTSSRKITRRSFLRKGIFTTIGFIGLSAAPFYGYFRERLWLETTHIELPYKSLPKSFDGLKIAHFSDIHYGFYYGVEELSVLVDEVNKQNPDLILFTGDLFDGEVLPYAEECARELNRLKAPLGRYAVLGNHDYYTGRTKAKLAYEQSGFRLLTNRSEMLKINNQTIQLVGLDDMFYGKVDINAAFSGVDPHTFTLLIAHEPDYADRTSAYRVDLQLSGHSHGGQVRLPIIGAILTPPGGRTYVQGLHLLENQDVPSYIYTTRGVGTTHVPIRFLCRPELSMITLRSER